MLGISFLPGNQQQQQQSPTNGVQPVQQALQMISLRLPRVTGANAIAPPSLLERQPGQPLPPVPGTPEWEELMRRLRQPGQPPSMPPYLKYPGQPGTPWQPSPPPATPPPHVTPILGPDDSPVGPPRPEVPSKPLPDDRMPFSAMFDHIGTRMY